MKKWQCFFLCSSFYVMISDSGDQVITRSRKQWTFDDWSVSHSKTTCPWHVILPQDPTWWKMDELETTIATKTSKKTHPIRGDIYTSLYSQPFFRTIQPVCFSRQKNPTCSPFEPKIHRKTGGCSFPIFFEPKILSFGTQGAIADVKWSWHFVGARVGWLVHFHWKED